MALTQVLPTWFGLNTRLKITSVFLLTLGRTGILVFGVTPPFQRLRVNTIVGHVEKRFAQPVSAFISLFDLIFFFHQGSSKSSPLLEFGIEEEVRVCESCYDRLTTYVSVI